MTAPDDLVELSVRRLRAGYLQHSFSPLEVFEAFAARIAVAEPVVHAFTTLALDRAHAEATAATAAYAQGHPRPLEGIPFAAKDLFDSRGVRTTYGSSMFVDNVPQRDAEAIRRLRDVGAVLMGKTATHEFAWGITSVNAHTGTPANPWRPDRITGGSSGGSAAAVAAREVPFALASDTGGSVRIPAGFCGVAGLKPTFGAISSAGVFPLSPSLDHVGLIAWDPGDLADLLDTLQGFDPADPATLVTIAPRTAPSGRFRVGICADLEPVRLEAGPSAAMAGARRVLEELGVELVEVAFPEAELVDQAFAITQRCEAYDTHHSRGLFPGRAAEYGDDVRGRLEAAAGIDVAQYLQAQRARGAVRAGFRNLFQQIDFLLTPGTPVGPPQPGSEAVDHFGVRTPLRAVVMPYMVPQDLAGLPAAVVRAGFDADGLPTSAQLTGPLGSDHGVLALTSRFFDATAELQARRPAAVTPAG